MDDPTREAVKRLQTELAELEARKLAPTQQAIIRRMLARALELKPIFAEIWDPARVRPHVRTADRVYIFPPDGARESFTAADFAAELEAERTRALQFITGAALASGQADPRREALATLPGLLDELGTQAQAMARTLDRITSQSERGGLLRPDYLYDPLAWMAKAAHLSRLYGFEVLARPVLEQAHSRHGRHLPDLMAMLEALATIGAYHLEEFTEADHVGHTRKRNPGLEYARVLIWRIRHEWAACFMLLQPLELTPGHLATLAEVITDCVRPEGKGFEVRMSEILHDTKRHD